VSGAELRELLASNIREIAGRKGMALNSIADFAAVSRAQLYDVLAGNKAATTDWIAKVADALEVEPWQLLAPSGKR